MAASRIRRNDTVVVLTGKDKGKKGIVRLIVPNKNKAIVSGINIVKKHQKPIPDKNQPGGIFKRESFIDLSNLAVFNPVLNKSDKVRFEVRNGKKIRVFKSNGNIVK